MNKQDFEHDLKIVQNSDGDTYIELYRNNIEVASLWKDVYIVEVEDRGSGVYLIISGCLRVLVDDYCLTSI